MADDIAKADDSWKLGLDSATAQAAEKLATAFTDLTKELPAENKANLAHAMLGGVLVLAGVVAGVTLVRR